MAASWLVGVPPISSNGGQGKGINPGYSCSMDINSKPSGGGRVSGGVVRGTVHPSSKGAASSGSVKAAMKGKY